MGFSNMFLGDDMKLGCFPSKFSIMKTLTKTSSEDMKGRCLLWEKNHMCKGNESTIINIALLPFSRSSLQ